MFCLLRFLNYSNSLAWVKSVAFEMYPVLTCMIFTVKSVTIVVEKYKCDWKLIKCLIYYYNCMMLKYSAADTWE